MVVRLVITLLLVWTLTACHTTRQTTEHTTQHTQAAAVSHTKEQSDLTADWWQSVRLTIDSAVVVFGDTLSSTGLRSEPATLPRLRASPAPAKVKLYGLRHATDAALHTDGSIGREQNDSTHVTSATATDASSREEATGIAKPPDLTVTIIVIAMLALILIYIRTR